MISSRLTRLFSVFTAALVVATLGCREDAESPTAPEPGPPLATTASIALSFRQVSAAALHTCGVTTGDRAYCWGYNVYGRLGDGTTTQQLTPVAVAGTLRFRRVSAGYGHSCGLTTGDRIYCWGRNAHGQLGNGTFRDQLKPVAVAGGLQFRDVSAGRYHTCGVTLNDRAYCWGRNDEGRLGDGTTDIERPEPVAVTGGLRFRQVSAGSDHTCGVTTANRAYCWGFNAYGQLGQAVSVSYTPVPVASLRSFSRVTAGYDFTCAVSTDNRAFCWGNGRWGQIGDGKDFLRFTPRAVAGGLLFRGVSAGGSHTCGVTTDDRAYCWGRNLEGQLGDGSASGYQSLKPVAVTGGYQFRQVDAGGGHTCGVTLNDRAYCWGGNQFGNLGDGTTTKQFTPVAVAGPM
ncbi:MAG TPA: hypothetical protein VFZ87_10825 [Gemmatimonadales bacterium]